MRFSFISLALCVASAIASPVAADTSDIEARQNHPAGPGRDVLIKALGQKNFNIVSKQVHQTGIAAAKASRALNPQLGLLVHNLLHEVNELEADLVSIGFNT